MVKKLCFLLFSLFTFFSTQTLLAEIVTVNVTPGTILKWSKYSLLEPQDTLNIVLSDPLGEVTLYNADPIVISDTIQCNGKLRIKSDSQIVHGGTITAPYIILENANITLGSNSTIDASGANAGGNIYVGGGWHGDDPNIKNAKILTVDEGAQIFADALSTGNGGIVVLWSDISTYFNGQIFARANGTSGSGGEVEISGKKHLRFDGEVDVSSLHGSSGHLTLDPTSITIQAASPDINGNGSGLDITSVTQLNDATTTPAGFPNASSIITAGALSGLLTNNVSLILAAQQFITVNAPITTASTNVTLTFTAPIVNLNSPITLGSGGVLAGVGASVVNVGPSGNPQNGIDIVSSGGTVNLATATYIAPLNILNKDLTLNGNGQTNTTILVTGAVPSHSSRNPAIYVQGGSSVIVQNLKVDCNNVGFPTNANITGILYVNAGGTISNTHITQVANTAPPYAGGQQGVAIRAFGTSGGPFVLNISGNTIDFFQKAAIVVSGALLTSNISNNTIIGQGLSTPAALGIQMSDGTGTISGNSISNLIFSDHQQSAAVLVFNTSPNVIVSANTISNSDDAIAAQNVGAGMIIQNNIIQNSGDAGIIVFDTSGTTQVLSNTLINNGGLSGPTGINASIYLFSTTSQSFNVASNSITPAPGTLGLFTQGQAAGQAPVVDLLNNAFIDP